MNITLTGNLGSGKSSVCRELKEMGYEIISTGSIFREIAQQKGISVIELNEFAKKSREIDDMIDNRSIELGKTKDNAVFDSRLAWHFIPDSFKVFLLVDTQEAADRVYNGENRNSEEYASYEDTLAGLQKRAELEKERFLGLYGINYYDAANYNLILESTVATPRELAEEIVRNYKLFQEQPFQGKIELNLRNLYPTEEFESLDMEAVARYEHVERENNALCAQKYVSVMVENGFNYIAGNEEYCVAAVKAGKVFAQVKTGKPLQDGLKAFEEFGGFQYKFYPDKAKAGYNLDFSKLV